MEEDRRSLWIIKQYAVTPDMPGNTRHFELGRRLVQRGYEVTIIATSFHYSQHREMRLEAGESWKAEEVDGVRFVWIRTFPFRGNDWRRVVHMLSFMLRTYRVGKRLPKLSSDIFRPVVILGCSIPPFAALSGYWLSKYYRARFFFEVGDLWPQTLIDMGALTEKNPVTKALQLLERFLYQHAEKIITPLPNASSYIQEYGVVKRKVIWLPNGVDFQSFNRPQRAKQPGQKFTVMYAGLHGRAQSLETLLEAAEIIQTQGYERIRFVLIGDGPEKLRLCQLADDLELRNLEFLDSIPKSEVPRVLGKASTVIFSLRDTPVFRRYGVGSKKLFDYLAIGVPVVFAVRSSNNPVEEAQCGITVSPEDPQALAQAIATLYESPEEGRRAMGERGRKYVEKYHDWSILTDRFQACIERKLEQLE